MPVWDAGRGPVCPGGEQGVRYGRFAPVSVVRGDDGATACPRAGTGRVAVRVWFSVCRIGAVSGLACFFRGVEVFQTGFSAFVEQPVDGCETFTFFRGQAALGFDRQIEYESDDFSGIDDECQMIDVQWIG